MNKPTYQTLDISIRAPARGATTIALNALVIQLFQSALPRGERQDHVIAIMSMLRISIRAPARGATILGNP